MTSKDLVLKEHILLEKILKSGSIGEALASDGCSQSAGRNREGEEGKG